MLLTALTNRIQAFDQISTIIVNFVLLHVFLKKKLFVKKKKKEEALCDMSGPLRILKAVC